MPTEVFDPEAFGARLQRFFPIQPEYQVVEDERELGNVNSYAVAEKVLRAFTLTYHCPDPTGYEYIESFFHRLVGPAARFDFELPELLFSPDAAPTLVAVAGGAQAERTILVKFAWETAAGRTRASPAGSLLVPVNELIKVTVPVFPASATAAVIYATQGAAGTEVEQTELTNTRTWTQPDAALLTGTMAPGTTNAALETIQAKLIAGSKRAVRGHGRTYVVELGIQETY